MQKIAKVSGAKDQMMLGSVMVEEEVFRTVHGGGSRGEAYEVYTVSCVRTSFNPSSLNDVARSNGSP